MNGDNQVQFQESQFSQQMQQPSQNSDKGLTSWIMKISGGKIKTREQANMLFIVVSVLFLIVALFLIINSFGGGPEMPSEEEIFRDTPPPPGVNM